MVLNCPLLRSSLLIINSAFGKQRIILNQQFFLEWFVKTVCDLFPQSLSSDGALQMDMVLGSYLLLIHCAIFSALTPLSSDHCFPFRV